MFCVRLTTVDTEDACTGWTSAEASALLTVASMLRASFS